MKKKNMTPEDLRRMEYQFSEYKDALSTEFVNAMEQAFDTMRPYIEKELPMRNELFPVIEKLIYKQYFPLSSFGGSWRVRWISEISERTAQELAALLSLLFDDFEKGVDRTELYDDFEGIVKFYTLPKEAHQCEMPNFEGTPFWEQEKEGIQKELEEDYEEDKISCEHFNRMKTEFILAIQPIIIKYFG